GFGLALNLVRSGVRIAPLLFVCVRQFSIAPTTRKAIHETAGDNSQIGIIARRLVSHEEGRPEHQDQSQETVHRRRGDQATFLDGVYANHLPERGLVRNERFSMPFDSRESISAATCSQTQRRSART